MTPGLLKKNGFLTKNFFTVSVLLFIIFFAEDDPYM